MWQQLTRRMMIRRTFSGLAAGMLAWGLLSTGVQPLLAAPPTGAELLASMDKNRDYESMTYTGVMKITLGGQLRTKTMKTESLIKKKKSVVEFINPEDKGTKYLMLGSELWIYFAEEDDVVKISGHMLKEGMMGSDVSYEDALSGDTLSQKYDMSVTGEEALDGKACYVLELNAKVPEAPYAKRKMWVEKSTYVALKEEMYAKSGKLLKVSKVLEVRSVDGRNVPSKVEMSNMLRGNSKTVFEMTEMKINPTLSEDRFTMQFLRR